MVKFSKEDIKSILATKNKFHKLAWQPTKWCNYRCEYCIQGQNNYKNKLAPFEELSKHADRINSAIEKLDKDCALFLIGGEVTYIDLVRIFKEHLNSKRIKQIHITTNLSRCEKWWDEFSTYCKENDIELIISASLHITQVKKIDEFINKAKKFASTVSVVINDNNYELVKNALEKLVASGYNNKIVVNIDRHNTEVNSKSEKIQKLVEKYSYISPNKQLLVTLKSGETIEMSKAELQEALNGNMDLSGFKCTTWARYRDGIIRRGGCGWKLKLSGKDDMDYDTSICQCKNCSFCTVINVENPDNE